MQKYSLNALADNARSGHAAWPAWNVSEAALAPRGFGEAFPALLEPEGIAEKSYQKALRAVDLPTWGFPAW